MRRRTPRPRPAAASADPARRRARQISRALAVGEGHALGGETGGEGRRRRVGLDVDERRRRPSRRGPRAGVRRAGRRGGSAGRRGPRWRGRARRSAGPSTAARSSAAPWPAAASARARSPRAGRGSTSIGVVADDGGAGPGARAGEAVEDRERPACPSRRRTRGATNGAGRPSRSPGVGDAPGRAPRRRSGAPRVRSGSRPSRPGRAVARPVVAAVRVVQRELHEPGERHRSVARDLGADPRRRARRPGRRRRGPAAGRAGARRQRPSARRGRPADARAGRPGPTSVWPPSRIGIGAVDGGRGQLRAATDRRSRSGEQQVRGEAVLGRRPARLVGAEPVGEEDPAVDDRRVGELGQVRAERPRAVAVEQRAEDRRPDRALLRRRGSGGRAPRPSARVREAVWRFEPGEARRGGPAGDEELARRSAAVARTAASAARRAGTSRSRRASVSKRRPRRPSGRGRAARRGRPRAASGAEVVRPVRRRSSSEPARQGVVGRRGRAASASGLGAARSRRRPPSSGCSRGPAARRTRGRRDERRAIGRPARAGSRRSRGRRARPAARPDAAPEPSPRTTRRTGRLADDLDVGRAGGRRSPRGDARRAAPGPRRASVERAGAGRGRRVEDADGDRRTAASLAEGGATWPMRRVRAYIGLGANLGDPPGRRWPGRRGRSPPCPDTRLRGVSRLYATAPVGVTDQPEFRNAVVALDVPAGPDPATGALALLVALKELERAFGRAGAPSAGARASSTSTCSSSVAPGSSIDRPPDGHRRVDPGQGRPPARGPPSRGRRAAVRARAAGRPRARPRAARLGRDRRDGRRAAARRGGPRRRPADRDVGRRPRRVGADRGRLTQAPRKRVGRRRLGGAAARRPARPARPRPPGRWSTTSTSARSRKTSAAPSSAA